MLISRPIIWTPAIAVLLLLSACQFGGNNALPPRPTVVPVVDTPTSQPTTAPIEERAVPAPSPEPAETPTDIPTKAPLSDAGVETEPATGRAADTVPLEPSPTHTQAPTATPVNSLPLEALSISLRPIATGLSKPLHLTHAGDGSGRLFVVEQAGRVYVLKDGITVSTPFLDIVSIVGSDANEQGLLSVAFHPNYITNGFFFVYYTNIQGDAVIARYQVSADPNVADSNSAVILLTVGQPFANHNGGQLTFGLDGYLYVGLGDGGAANDPQNNGQSLSTLLGKIIRLDVDNAEPYGVPETNPLVASDTARPEIWSYGWRNPWRFSFDRATGDMYIADVGQNQYEEVHVEFSGAPSGRNYGWRLMEGFHCFNQSNCEPASLGLELPVAEYDHNQGCSITGGYVYRGGQYPALDGTYFYGDYCSGTIWGLRQETDGSWSEAQLLQTNHTISSFGEDEAGEIYLVDHRGNVLQITN